MKFSHVDCEPLSVLIYIRAKILVEQYPTTLIEMEDMAYVSLCHWSW
jgi:hypothetical protein